MTVLNYTGLTGSFYGANFQTLNQTMDSALVANVGVAAIDDGSQAMTSFAGSNSFISAHYAGYSFQLAYTGGSNYVVTSLTASFGNGSSTPIVASFSGAHVNVHMSTSGGYTSIENVAALNAAIDRMLSGDDSLNLAGSLSVAWGDYGNVPAKGGIMGNDVIMGGVITLPAGFTQLLIVGDALTVGKGVTAKGGNDIIDMSATSVGSRICGDFQTVTGKASYGNDVIYGSSTADQIYGDAVNSGRAGGKDWIFGGYGADQIFGGGGNDRLNGGGGTYSDHLNGGAGFDLACYATNSTIAGIMIADLANPSANTQEAVGDIYTSIEGLVGRGNSDDLRGNAKANILIGLDGSDNLEGRAGNDRLDGGDNNDVLNGGLGNDILIGGRHSDVFVFDTTLNSTTNFDLIKDFSSIDDKILLGLAIFDLSTPSGSFLKGTAFHANLTGVATDSSDRIIYETDTGKLFYDADGVDGADGILFAILKDKPTIVAGDFQML